MALKFPDTAVPMGDFPAAMAEHIDFSDGKSLQEKYDLGELGGEGGGHVELTQAEYDALSEEEKLNGVTYFITDAPGGGGDDSSHVELTQAEYDALSDNEKDSDTIYFITDAIGGGGDISIDDNNISTETTWSSAKIFTEMSDNYAIFEGIIGDSYYSTTIDDEDIANVPVTDLYGDWTLDKVTTNLTEGSVISAFYNATEKKIVALTGDARIGEVYTDSFSVYDDTMNNGGKPYKVALLWSDETNESKDYEASITINFSEMYNQISSTPQYSGNYQEMKEAYDRGDKIKMLVKHTIDPIEGEYIVCNYVLDLASININDNSFNFEYTDSINNNYFITIQSDNRASVQVFSLDRTLNEESKRGLTNQAITQAFKTTERVYPATTGSAILMFTLLDLGITTEDMEKDFYLFDVEVTGSRGEFAHAKIVYKYKTLNYLEVITENGIEFTSVDTSGFSFSQQTARCKVKYLGLCTNSSQCESLTTGVYRNYKLATTDYVDGKITTIKAAAGANINTVGTPTVTATTSGTETTFTFNNLKGATGGKGDTGTRGSQWFRGTGITGTSTTATVFSGSGVSSALVNDMYFNTSTGYVYQCTVAGNASAAKWVYIGSLKGANGTTPTIKAAAGSNINTVGTPSVTASTSGNETTFTFNNLKGAKGDVGATPVKTYNGMGGAQLNLCTLKANEGAIFICVNTSGGKIYPSIDNAIKVDNSLISTTNGLAMTAGKYYVVANTGSSEATVYSKSNGGNIITVIGPGLL